MGFVRPVLAVVVLLVLAACNSDALPPASQFATLQGTIIDRATNSPIVGALVTVDTVLTATTDENGTFHIAEVPSGDFDYTVQAKGYATFSGTARAEPGKPFVLGVQMLRHKPSPEARSTGATITARS